MTELNNSILDLLRNSHGHLTAEEVFLMAKEKGIRVSLASVYRILSKLAEDGCIRRIVMSDRPDIFDKSVFDHQHIICSVCSSVRDIAITGLKESLEKAAGTEIISYCLTAEYICDNCAKRDN